MKNRLFTSLRKLQASTPKLLSHPLIDHSAECRPAIGRKDATHNLGIIPKRDVGGRSFSGGLLRPALASHNCNHVRTKSETTTKNPHCTHKVIVVQAHCAHSADMAKPNSTTRGYAGSKKRTNLSLDSELVEIAQKHFPATRHGSLSGFVENSIRREFRALAPKLRRAGFKLPESLFVKA